MPRKKTTKSPGQGMTAKQRKRRKPISEQYMLPIEPLTDNQKVMFDAWDADKMIYAYGVAGTGKTFVALYKALKDVLGDDTPYEKIYIVRSLVATREIGFLPGDHEDKSSLYQIPYKNIVQAMFEMPDDNSYEMLYDNLKAQETISFWSTSFIRGTTLDNAIVIIDEAQNLNFHELDSIITRVGQDSKIIFCSQIQKNISARKKSHYLGFNPNKKMNPLEHNLAFLEVEVEGDNSELHKTAKRCVKK